MGIFKSLTGMVTAELTSADISGTLAGIGNLGVCVFDVRTEGDLTARIRLFRRDYKKVLRLTKRRGDRFRLIEKSGIYWDLKGLLSRPVLLMGMVLLLVLVFFVPTRVLFVQVEGNDTVPARKILAAAEDSGICFGASRREVRSEKIKNSLLAAVPELQWAGVNTYGCTAVISVRERSVVDKTEKNLEVSSIVADRDGVILSCTVTQGNSLCAVGQAVREGEILISGYTDCGLCITATRAEGEVIALTRRNLTVKTPSSKLLREAETGQTTNFSLIVGKNRINFYKGSGIYGGSCVKMYSEYCLTLPGGFRLPVALVRETVICYDSTSTEISEDAALAELSDYAADYLRRRMVAGTITDASGIITPENGAWCLTEEYACIEMIGRRQQAQIGEYHETN